MKLIAMALAAASSMLVASAATATPFSAEAPTTQTIVQKAYYNHHWHHGWDGPRYGFYGPRVGIGYGYGYGNGGPGCWRVRHRCGDEWGWGGPGFRRCMWRLGC